MQITLLLCCTYDFNSKQCNNWLLNLLTFWQLQTISRDQFPGIQREGTSSRWSVSALEADVKGKDFFFIHLLSCFKDLNLCLIRGRGQGIEWILHFHARSALSIDNQGLIHVGAEACTDVFMCLGVADVLCSILLIINHRYSCMDLTTQLRVYMCTEIDAWPRTQSVCIQGRASIPVTDVNAQMCGKIPEATVPVIVFFSRLLAAAAQNFCHFQANKLTQYIFLRLFEWDLTKQKLTHHFR